MGIEHRFKESEEVLDKVPSQEHTLMKFASIDPPQELFRIVTTETGWNVVVNPEVSMTEAARKFISIVNDLKSIK
ncbi:MAG: hypothetical protein EBR82_31865 [Caulobacteraceae bacterium]|nr:hypothetical protein [Caulobacteraceae bacterium]